MTEQDEIVRMLTDNPLWLSCPRISWTPICPTGGRYGGVQYEQDQTT